MILLYIAILVASIAVILYACELFTNGVEWAGHKLDLSHGATGSILAAVGTALPETSIPILALMAGSADGSAVAVGAIAGAPFMLATLTLCVTGSALFYYSLRGMRRPVLEVDAAVVRRDLGFFILIYSVAVLTTFVHSTPFRYAVAAALSCSYAFYMYVTLRHQGESAGSLEELHFTTFFRLPKTRRRYILLQITVSLVLIFAGAHYFVVGVTGLAPMLGIPTMILSLVVTPVATELPEKMNSVLWIRDGKDTLAIGNITGAMVFQSSFPVAVGVAFTNWDLSGPTMVSAVIALVSATVCYLTLKIHGRLPARLLVCGGLLYAGFLAYILL